MQNTCDPKELEGEAERAAVEQQEQVKGKGKETRSSFPEINASEISSVWSNWRNKPGILIAGCLCLKYSALTLGKSLPTRTVLRGLRG